MADNNTKNKSSKNSGGGFESLKLSPAVFSGIKKLGYRTPTPVQRKSLPVLLSGTDAVVMARTGSGKTAAFLIPVLERLLAVRGDENGNSSSSSSGGSKSAFAVILSPTRELSVQTLKVLRTLGHHCLSQNSFKFVGINGGEGMEKQFSLLSSHPDIIVATPGRLAHHLSEIPDFHLRQCEMAVFDEADRLFEMGFVMQLRQICHTMPEHAQKMLFSATMPKALMEFTKTGMMHDPVVVRLDNEVAVSEELRIGFVTCRSAEKDAVLLHLVRDVLPLMKGTDTTGANVEEDEEVEEEEAASTKKKKKKAKKQKHVGKHSKRGLTLIFVATRHHCEYITLLLNTSGLAATQIYGNMDNSARQHNLSSFQSGRCPILVVTDVAARGIDIPLIDHVVHYAFPPSAKLFIHRSGRAARAGRIGYCWGVVDPDELPYMVDLHVFLGRKLSTALIENSDGGEEDDEAKSTEDDQKESDATNTDKDRYITYTLDEMTPDMVHYGSVPESVLVEEVENVRRLVDSELAGSHDSEQLRSLTRVCNNAMKKYRRTRPEASRDGVRRAKALLEGDKVAGGQRVLKARGGIPTHPLLRQIEIDRVTASLGKTDGNGDSSTSHQVNEEMARKKMNDLQKRQEFLLAMSNFRPKETVFEAFATGGQKDMIYSSQVDKNKSGSAAALVAMKSMRRQMKMARNKGTALVVAGSKIAQELNGDVEEDDQGAVAAGMKHDEEDDDIDAIPDHNIIEKPQSNTIEGKRRLSKAERKKMKKDPFYKPTPSVHDEDGNADDVAVSSKKAKAKRGSDFRDEANFIDNNTTPDTAAAARERQMEAAMQPSASNSAKGTLALAHRIEESMLDIVGDENIDLVKRHRMMRWDRSKRKYVQTTVGDELSGMSTTKKTKLESGQMVDSKKMKIGELYEKWQKKTNKSIGRVGIFDDVTDDTDDSPAITKKTQRATNNGKGADDVKKTAVAIRKEREKSDNLRKKNMRKEDRRILERKERADKLAAAEAKKKGFQSKKSKKGKSTRWNNGRK